MKLRNKSMANWKGIASVSTLSTILLITLALASQNFEISTDKETYYQNQDIYVMVNGPGNTGFTIKILNPNDLVISEKKGKTTPSGNAYLQYDGFSSQGEYKARLLIDNNVKAVTAFRIVKPGETTTTTTTATHTTITVTTSTIFPTTPTTGVVTTGDKGAGSGLGTTRPTISIKPKKDHFRAEEAPEFELEIQTIGINALTSLKPKAHIEDSHGKSIEIEPEIKKSTEGYKIKIPRKRSIQPGLYKLVVDYEGEKEELWFQWGLVSVNTKKSIYKPGETAEILMVVLDKDGHLVSGADVQLKVKNPGGVITHYSTLDGSINELERGIYKANHTATWQEGNYSLSVTATAEGVTSSIESYFSVKEYYEFDILREIPLTIDLREGPFESRIKVISYTNSSVFDLREHLPEEFNVTDGGGAYINVTEGEIMLEWRNLTNNSLISYSAQVPSISPYLYQLGPAEINYKSGIFREARLWLLAVDPSVWPSTGLRPQTCSAESESAQGSWDTPCVGTYPAACPTDRVSCDDVSNESHITRKSTYAGIRLSYYNTSIDDCLEITKVEVCYQWWTDRADPSTCDISVDNDGDASWSAAVLSCPGTTEPATVTCTDVTNKDGGDWVCSNFFGSTGTRAEIKSELLSTKNPPTNVYWDVFFYNVTYASAGYLNSTLNEPTPGQTLNIYTNEMFTLNATVTCEGNPGDTCGTVTGIARYNSSGVEPDTQISTTPGAQPFYANIGTQNCGTLSYGESCTLNWTINATQAGKWNVDVNFSSPYSMIESNNTGNAEINVTPTPLLAIDLTYPSSDPNISEGETFELNCTANCTGSECKDVNVSAVYCSGSLTCKPNETLNTTSMGLRSNLDNVNLGSVYTIAEETATFTITGLSTGDYVIACNATSSNAGNVTSLPTNTSLHVNDPPVAAWDYPSFGEHVHGIEVLNATSSSDSDGAIQYAEFWADNDSGYTSLSLICNDTSSADGWNCSWDTTTDPECSTDGNCYLRVNVVDDDRASNYTDVNVVIDNTGPTASLDLPANDTYIATESQLVNATADDGSGSGVSCVEFQAYYDSGWNNLSVDCSPPYEYNWDLSSVNDQTGIEVRARANDTESNFGGWNTHGNITHDTTPPVAVLDHPVDNEITQNSPYTLNATSSSDPTSGVRNASFYYWNSSSSNWELIGSDTTPGDGLTYTWDINLPDGLYNISVNVTDKAGLEGNDTNFNFTVDLQNQNPTCTVSYPNGGENVSGIVVVNATVNDPDPGDVIKNVTFNYSKDNGINWNLIGTNDTEGLLVYALEWDTNGDSDSDQYFIRCLVEDGRGGKGQDDSDSVFTVDNTPPTISNEQINDTSLKVNDIICLNVTVTDNLVAVDSVWAEIDVPGIEENDTLTLLDDGKGCDPVSGDDVYSGKYQNTQAGEYNWTKTKANDTLGNLNTTYPGKTWTVSSSANMTINMTEPSTDIEIDESPPDNTYNQTCNVSCDQGGLDCINVSIWVQYNPGTWTDVTTSTSDLINSVDNHSCGTLTAGGAACEYTFLITAGSDTGGNSWGIRCKATSSNAATAYSTETVTLTINDFPVAAWDYPSPGEYVHGIEVLNATSSSDSDGAIQYAEFWADNDSGYTSLSLICNDTSSADGWNGSWDTTTDLECSTDGNCYLRVNVVDDDGASNYTDVNVVIDNTGPAATLDRPLNNDNITTDTYEVNATIIDLAGVDWVFFEYRENPSSEWKSACNDTDGDSEYNCTWNLTGLVDSAQYEVRARANDTEGNLGDWDNHIGITVDRTKPQITLNFPPTGFNTTTENITFNFTVIDSIASTLNCSLYIDSELNQTNESVQNGTPTLFNVTGISENIHSWYVNCSDSFYSNKSETRTFTVDHTNPAITLISPGNDSTITSGTTIDLNVTDDNLAMVWWSKNGGTTNNTLYSPYDIDTTGWSEGLTVVDVWANDSADNLNHTQYKFTIDDNPPQITLNFPPTGFNTTTENITFNFTVIDSIASTLNCSLYIDSELNQTNESVQNGTPTLFNVTGISENIHSWYVNCSDSFYSNKSETRTFTVDHTNPAWSKQNQTINGNYMGIYHRGETIKLTAYWTDNVQLSTALLDTNESGLWENKTGYGSPLSFSGTGNWSNFTWSNSSIALGTSVGWRIHANDSVGNRNSTAVMNFTIWGWVEISDSSLNPSTINQGESTTMKCKVTDNVTGALIQNYSVYFYNSTDLMGTNGTLADGWASWTFTDNSTGYETITCNITDNATLYYNKSGNNEAQKILNTLQVGAPIIYRVVSDPCERDNTCRAGIIIYNTDPNPVNLTEVRDKWSLDKIASFAQCCTPDGCSVTYCSESPAGTVNFSGAPWTIPPYEQVVFWYEANLAGKAETVTFTANITTAEYGNQAQDRTDVDIINDAACAWTAWNDTEGFDFEAQTPNNLTASAGKKNSFTIRLREFCNVDSLSGTSLYIAIPPGWSTGTLDGNCLESGNRITCSVGVLQGSYKDYDIEFIPPNQTGKYILQTNVTGNDGSGTLHEDVNDHVVVVKDRTPSAWNNQNQTIAGQYSDVVHRNETITLSAFWSDNILLDSALLETNESGLWENKTTYGSPQELTGKSDSSTFTWQNSSIAPGTIVGWRIYANDTSGNTNVTDIMSFTIWGWSNLSWISPSGGNYSQNKDIDLICRVTDATNSIGVQGYPVKFYRGGILLGTNTTNPTGYAKYTWNTGSLSTGNYELKCNITDNATLFYNKTAENEDSTTITIDAEYPEITLQSPLSGSYTADTTINFSFLVTDNLAEELNCSLYVDNQLKDTNETTQNNTPTTLTATGLSISSHQLNITCKDKALNQNWSETWSFTIYEGRTVNVTVINSTGITFENTEISILDILEQEISGKTITLSDAILSDELAINQRYDIETITPLPGGNLTARIKDLNITGNLTIKPQVVGDYPGKMPWKIENVTAIYALNDTGLSYNLTELYIPKNGLNISSVVHCVNWNFATANCSQWEVNATEDYNMSENSTHIWFNVTDFTAFGGGKGVPLPNVTEIRIYDVTGLGNTHSGGTLIDSGLNTTFNFFKREPKVYRVEIDVRNDASTQWTIAPEDDVYHEGLNSTWVINATADIWYHEGGINYTGGNWSNGRVTWNTSLGGKLTNAEMGTFYYVFNMTTSKTEQYPVYFLCNDTSTGSGSYDNSVYNITRVGYLEVNLTLPPQIPGQGDAESNTGYKVGQNKIFIINGTVYCRDGYCGNVNGTLRYNQSSSLPDTPVNTTAGDKPFYVLSGINPKNCSENPLDKDDFCSLSWQVNATGNLTSLWKLDVLFNSSLSDANETNYTKIEITLVLILSLSWTETNFGVCDPVTFGNAASKNDEKGYNISLNENSNDVDGLYIMGTDLEPQSVTGFGSINYTIGVGNLTWNDNENQYSSSNTTRFTLNYDLIRSDVPAGTNITMYFWIDIPKGQYAQGYDGMLYIKVNTTREY